MAAPHVLDLWIFWAEDLGQTVVLDLDAIARRGRRLPFHISANDEASLLAYLP